MFREPAPCYEHSIFQSDVSQILNVAQIDVAGPLA